jgi:hypothetical protein
MTPTSRSAAHSRSAVLLAQLLGEPDGIVASCLRLASFAARKARAEWQSLTTTAPGYIEHFGVHQPMNNAGDTVLFDTIEKLFDGAFGSQRWRRTQLRREVGATDVERMNRCARAVLVGGGGLLISDTNPNALSGWQWKISRELLERLEVPLIVFAIGYNQFRDPVAFPAVFRPHLEATVARSAFFGARNGGSVDSIRSLLPEALRSRVVLQPCMTSFLRHYHPTLQPGGRAPFAKRMALNLAFDRPGQRYGGRESDASAQIRKLVEWALDDGWDVTAVLHSSYDDPATSLLRGFSRKLAFRRLNLASADEVIRFYASMPVTIGMRGHAQMIPFGCGNAIFSIVSHDKMGYFLRDIDRPEWGADVLDPELADKAIAFLDDLERSWADVGRHIDAHQSRLWSLTRANLSRIARAAGWATESTGT